MASTMSETGLVIECPMHGGAFDCTPFCANCEGEQETLVTDLWTALDNPPAGCEAVARLYSWGYNETRPTFGLFMDLSGISGNLGAWYVSELRQLGYVECDLLGNALTAWADRPSDVFQYVKTLLEMESGK